VFLKRGQQFSYRNIRIEEDLIDQLFNSSEKRLARALLLLACYGKPDISQMGHSQSISADAGGNDRQHAVSVNLLMNPRKKRLNMAGRYSRLGFGPR
jgi:hypothetical protein